MTPTQVALEMDAAAGVGVPAALSPSDALVPVPLRTVSGRSPVKAGRPRILMTTEGTYPYAVGGVSSWCDLVIGGLHEFDWQILPVMAGDRRLSAIFELPAHATLAGQIELWSEGLPRRRWTPRRERSAQETLPANLMRALISWEGSYED